MYDSIKTLSLLVAYPLQHLVVAAGPGLNELEPVAAVVRHAPVPVSVLVQRTLVQPCQLVTSGHVGLDSAPHESRVTISRA